MRIFSYFILILLCVSCSKDYNLKETDINTNNDKRLSNLTSFQKEALAYFKEISLGFEYGNQGEIVKKWAPSDTLNLLFEYRSPNISDQGSLIQPSYYPADKDDIRLQRRLVLLNSLKTTVDTLNKYLAASKCHINIVEADGNKYSAGPILKQPNFQNSVSSQKHNGLLVFASRAYFLWRYPDATQLQAQYGNGALWSIMQNDPSNTNRITGCRICCVLDQTGAYDNNLAVLKSFIKEELVQPLGFFRDSEKHPSSIFYETANDGGFSTKMSDLDKEVIRLMYHPDIKIGMSGMQAQQAIIGLYNRENE